MNQWNTNWKHFCSSIFIFLLQPTMVNLGGTLFTNCLSLQTKLTSSWECHRGQQIFTHLIRGSLTEHTPRSWCWAGNWISKEYLESMKRSFKLSGYATTFTEVRRMGIFPGGAAGDSTHGRSLEILWKNWGPSEILRDAATRKPFQLHQTGMGREKKWGSISHKVVVTVWWICEILASVAPRCSAFDVKRSLSKGWMANLLISKIITINVNLEWGSPGTGCCHTCSSLAAYIVSKTPLKLMYCDEGRVGGKWGPGCKTKILLHNVSRIPWLSFCYCFCKLVFYKFFSKERVKEMHLGISA